MASSPPNLYPVLLCIAVRGDRYPLEEPETPLTSYAKCETRCPLHGGGVETAELAIKSFNHFPFSLMRRHDSSSDKSLQGITKTI